MTRRRPTATVAGTRRAAHEALARQEIPPWIIANERYPGLREKRNGPSVMRTSAGSSSLKEGPDHRESSAPPQRSDDPTTRAARGGKKAWGRIAWRSNPTDSPPR